LGRSQQESQATDYVTFEKPLIVVIEEPKLDFWDKKPSELFKSSQISMKNTRSLSVLIELDSKETLQTDLTFEPLEIEEKYFVDFLTKQESNIVECFKKSFFAKDILDFKQANGYEKFYVRILKRNRPYGFLFFNQ